MDRWDILLLGFASYIAITTLVKLMAARRNELVDQVKAQVEQQKMKQQAQQAKAEAENEAA